MIKNNKTQTIKTRITEEENEQILQYCKKNNINRSAFLRLIIEKFFKNVKEANNDNI